MAGSPGPLGDAHGALTAGVVGRALELPAARPLAVENGLTTLGFAVIAYSLVVTGRDASASAPSASGQSSRYWLQTRWRPSSKDTSGSQPVSARSFEASASVSNRYTWSGMYPSA